LLDIILNYVIDTKPRIMKKMTIAQALKEKNKLASKIRINWFRISTKNALPKGAVRPYDINQVKEETLKMIDELIKLKTNIHLASSPVREKIFRLSELKAILTNLEKIPTAEGLTKDKYENSYTEMESILKTVEVDDMISKYQDEIDELQNELDSFNYITMIS
jgi:hypothetical protein